MITIMKFSAEWCAPCKRYDPILDEVVGSRDDVELVRVDIEEQPDLTAQFSVSSVPYTVLKQGETYLGGFKGPVTVGKLNNLLDSFKEN